MDKDQKFWLSFWAIMFAAVLALASVAALYHYNETATMVEGGYEQVYDPLCRSCLWKKIK